MIQKFTMMLLVMAPLVIGLAPLCCWRQSPFRLLVIYAQIGANRVWEKFRPRALTGVEIAVTHFRQTGTLLRSYLGLDKLCRIS